MTAPLDPAAWLLLVGLLEDLQDAIERGDADGAIALIHLIASVAGVRYANRVMAALIEAGQARANGPESSGESR